MDLIAPRLLLFLAKLQGTVRNGDDAGVGIHVHVEIECMIEGGYGVDHTDQLFRHLFCVCVKLLQHDDRLFPLCHHIQILARDPADPETKRGISPLYCVLSLAHFQEDLVNRTCNLQSLNENPPLLAPEGFFDEDEIELYPGKIIEYGDNLTPTAAFQQMSFNPTVFLNDISFLNDLMAEVSGIFPNMIGSVETTAAKTATEINTKAQGQMTRLSMLLDTINQDFILPNVEKVAKLCADFKSGVERVFVNKENQPETIEIDDFVRQADYKYTYSDRSNTTLKSEQADLLIQAVQKFPEAGLQLNLEEIFVWYFEQKGVENVERFLGVNGLNGLNGVNEGVNVSTNLQNPTLPLPLLQLMVQNLRKRNVEANQIDPTSELQNVIEENKEV